ncbi:MAG TPA: SCO1664 family protein [Acidimicrobiia bacterium]|nr:SCO1664 family protein [Acidimicrobiia bacterium]
MSETETSGWPEVEPVDEAAACAVLRDGEVEVLGRMPWSSNATFLVCLSLGSDQLLGIYKPQRGERPLWDFARGTLCRREVAAREISEVLGGGIVPDTVLRDGPAGIGMMQRFIHHDPEEHYFTLLASHADAFRRMAAFDIVINNTDRKGGHCLRATDGGDIFGIDHGVSFHAQWKLRTVIWDFACEPIPPDVCRDLRRVEAELHGGLGDRLRALLDRFELDAVHARLAHLLEVGEYPDADRDYHSYPWPTI